MGIEEIQDHIKTVLSEKQVSFEIKKMFGGHCFMVGNKMCVGVYKPKKAMQPRLIARIGEHFYETALKQPFCSAFDLTGKQMKGFVFIENDGFENPKDLVFWIEKCLNFNLILKSE
ncbi:MAG: RNA methyltransferase [Cryomorphaceae bacterium]|nr:RNA methyltransferase [Cryomorphaceae bacterium]